MEAEQVELGKVYKCIPVELNEEIVGSIRVKYENTAILKVEDYPPQAKGFVKEKNHLVLALYSNIKEEVHKTDQKVF